MVKDSYEDLKIYEVAFKLAMKIHKESLKFPKFEMYEEGSQIRRSTKSITTNIIEGYGRRRYKYDFIKFLTYAHASCDETKVHLNFIHESGYINQETYDDYYEEYDNLGRMLNKFIASVEKAHKTRHTKSLN
ncbi:MAG: four helix bundle protein [Thermoplasmata archaeon]|nr:four helix bundle protein [Thermoplasmata archaeon]